VTPSYLQLREPASENKAIQTGQLRHNGPTTNLFRWHLQSPFQHMQYIQLGAASPSNFMFENLWLHRAVEEATNWRLDISKFPAKLRIASAIQVTIMAQYVSTYKDVKFINR
jgi:hypothetical protein